MALVSLFIGTSEKIQIKQQFIWLISTEGEGWHVQGHIVTQSNYGELHIPGLMSFNSLKKNTILSTRISGHFTFFFKFITTVDFSWCQQNQYIYIFSFCTARHESLWKSPPLRPDLDDGRNVCVHVPVQSHSHSWQLKGIKLWPLPLNKAESQRHDSIQQAACWTVSSSLFLFSSVLSGVDTKLGCCLWFLLLWTNSIVWSYSQWECPIQLLWDITRHCCLDGKQ